MNARIYCFEANDPADPLVQAAERLYLATQHPEERIPWGWIARSLKARASWRPGAPGQHLLVATPSERPVDPDALAGFAYGTFLPGFGGYVSYLGVEPAYRQRGVGTRLFEQMFRLLAADAGAIDEQLPFIMWESKQPEATAPAVDQKLWNARLRLFHRVGGYNLDGVQLVTPNYSDSGPSSVPLKLFIRPMDQDADTFTHEQLRTIVEQFLIRVYRMQPGDARFEETLARCEHACLLPIEVSREREPSGRRRHALLT